MEDEYVCKCCLVTRQEIEDAVDDDGVTTVEELRQQTMASSGCGKCSLMCEHIIREKLR